MNDQKLNNYRKWFESKGYEFDNDNLWMEEPLDDKYLTVKEVAELIDDYISDNDTPKLNITDKVLDTLGFSEYWDENGDWGGRTLKFPDGEQLRIAEFCEKEDDSDGYSSNGRYVANHFEFMPFFAVPPLKGDASSVDLFFLDDLYTVIKTYYHKHSVWFEELCNKNKMGYYLND